MMRDTDLTRRRNGPAPPTVERQAVREGRHRAKRHPSDYWSRDENLQALTAARRAKRDERVDSLMALYRARPDTGPTEAAKEIGVSRQTIYVYLRDLEAAGRIARDRDNGRVKVLETP